MRVKVEFAFLTDGDFGFDTEYFKDILINVPQVDYYGVTEFANTKDAVDFAKTLIEKIYTERGSIRNDISKMIKPIIRFLEKGNMGGIYKTMDGNQDKTFISAIIF